MDVDQDADAGVNPCQLLDANDERPRGQSSRRWPPQRQRPRERPVYQTSRKVLADSLGEPRCGEVAAGPPTAGHVAEDTGARYGEAKREEKAVLTKEEHGLLGHHFCAGLIGGRRPGLPCDLEHGYSSLTGRQQASCCTGVRFGLEGNMLLLCCLSRLREGKAENRNAVLLPKSPKLISQQWLTTTSS